MREIEVELARSQAHLLLPLIPIRSIALDCQVIYRGTLAVA